MLNKQDKALVIKLTEYKQQQNLTDAQFANKLGIPRTTWAQQKNGKRPVGLTLVKAIVRTFPDLIPDVIEFLKDDGTWKWKPERFSVAINRRGQADAG